MPARPLLVLLTIAVVAIAVAVALNRSPQPEVADAAAATPLETTTRGDASATVTTSAPTTSTPLEPTLQATTTTGRPAPTPTSLPESEVVCDVYSEIDVVGMVESEALVELSGAAVSRTTPGVIWAHNDSRDGPIVYAIGSSGEDLGAFSVPGATAFDWEDMAAGPGPEPGVSYLYLADIGDNFTIRDGRITVFRVPEIAPDPAGGVLPGAVALPFDFPDGAHNAEAIFVDPVDGSMYLVTKDSADTRVYRANVGGDGSSVENLELVGSLDLDAEVTAADISWDGSIIALRGYRSVWMWTRAQTETVAAALGVESCAAPAPDERQGEAIAFSADDAYLTISEGANPPLHRVERTG